MKRYFYTNGGDDVSGPIGRDELEEMVLSRRLGEEALLCHEGKEEWLSIKEVFPDWFISLNKGEKQNDNVSEEHKFSGAVKSNVNFSNPPQVVPEKIIPRNRLESRASIHQTEVWAGTPANRQPQASDSDKVISLPSSLEPAITPVLPPGKKNIIIILIVSGFLTFFTPLLLMFIILHDHKLTPSDNQTSVKEPDSDQYPNRELYIQLQHSDPEVQIKAFRELQTTLDQRLPEACIPLLKSEGYTLRRLAARAIGSRWQQISKEKVPIFVEALKNAYGDEDMDNMINRAIALLTRNYNNHMVSQSPNKRWVIYERRGWPCLIDTHNETEELLGFNPDYQVLHHSGNLPLDILWHPEKEIAAFTVNYNRNTEVIWIWRHKKGLFKIDEENISEGRIYPYAFTLSNLKWKGDILEFAYEESDNLVYEWDSNTEKITFRSKENGSDNQHDQINGTGMSYSDSKQEADIPTLDKEIEDLNKINTNLNLNGEQIQLNPAADILYQSTPLAALAYKFYDGELNVYYIRLMSILDNIQKNALKREQVQWIQKKEHEAVQAEKYGVVNIDPDTRKLISLNENTIERLKVLKRMYQNTVDSSNIANVYILEYEISDSAMSTYYFFIKERISADKQKFLLEDQRKWLKLRETLNLSDVGLSHAEYQQSILIKKTQMTKLRIDEFRKMIDSRLIEQFDQYSRVNE